MEAQRIGPGMWRRLQKQLGPEHLVFEERRNDDLEQWLGCYRRSLAEKELSSTSSVFGRSKLATGLLVPNRCASGPSGTT
jgi:hypothetical protein